MKATLLFLLFSITGVSHTLTIAIASNMSYVMPSLIQAFHQQYPNIKVQPIIGSSAKLTAQIMHHAPYGLFLSANTLYPQRLYAKGFSLFPPRVYAKGKLVLFSFKEKDFSDGITLLKDKNIKKIAIANPKTAPYGKASKEALLNAKLFKEIKGKLIYAESISQTLSYAKMATDIGIVAKSSLFSKQMRAYKKNIHWKEVDKRFYTPISQAMVLLKDTKQKEAYQKFYDFMLTLNAQNILKQYGYSLK